MRLRRSMAFCLSLAFISATFLSVCTRMFMPMTMPGMEGGYQAVSSGVRMTAHCETQDAAACAGDHMDLLSQVAPSKAESVSNPLFAVAAAIMAVVLFVCVRSLLDDARFTVAFKRFLQWWLYPFSIPILVFAFSRGIIHPKRHA